MAASPPDYTLQERLPLTRRIGARARAPASEHHPRTAPRARRDGERTRRRNRSTEKHRGASRESARGRRTPAGRPDAPRPRDPGALLRPDRADVLRRGRARLRHRADGRRLQRLRVAARESETAFNAGNSGASSATRGSRTRRPRASGSAWRSSSGSSTNYRAAAKPFTGSPSASTRPMIRAFPRPLSEAAPGEPPKAPATRDARTHRTPVRRLSRTFAQANN